jgi:type 1 glutamine amidotransferase
MPLSRRSLLLTPLAASLVQAQQKLRVLVIDGINNHDWLAGTRGIRAMLESSGRFTADVSTTPPAEAPRDAWDASRPDYSSYAAEISNFNGGHKAEGIRWPPRVERALDSYLRAGGGFVSFHAANNAFLEWADYNEMIGLGWRDKTFGPELILGEDESVVVVPAGEGLGPGHGPRHDFVMTMRDPRHPITAGLPKRWMHPAEQLTHGQHAPAHPKHGAIEKELTIITYALSKDSQHREPMGWVRRWGRGRIYTTMLGHTWKDEDNPNLRCVGFQTLFARGVEWAASGKVTIAVPPEFPSDSRPLLREIAADSA